MSRCSQTDSILQMIFADRDLTRDQMAHAALCAACAHAVAEARRFDRAMWLVGSEVTEEALPAAHTLPDSPDGEWEARSMGSRRSVATGVGVALAVVLAVVAGGPWLSTQLSDRLNLAAIQPEVVDAWVEAARALAVAEAPLGPRDPAIWEPVQVEVCGEAAIAFYSDPNRQAGYVWAIGHPREPANAILNTGRAARIEDADVAQLRAMLPVCEVVFTDREASGVVLRALPIESQTVVLVPAFLWAGAPDDAPILVEGPDDVEVGIRQDAYFQGRVDDSSVLAVDIVTESARLRFPASVPGFVAETDLDGEMLRFEFRDSQGNIVGAGPVAILGPGDARRALEFRARSEVLAETERQALEDGRPGIQCEAWLGLAELQQVALVEVVIPDLERARAVEGLPPGAAPAEIVASARASLEEGCDASPRNSRVADVARALYEEG